MAELLQRCSSRELSEWYAFYQLEPFGFRAGLLGPAITSTVVANANRRKGARALAPDDFIPPEPRSELEERARSDGFFDQLKRHLKGMSGRNGNDRRSARKTSA